MVFMANQQDKIWFWALKLHERQGVEFEPRTGEGCMATPFKYPKFWIQPPKTNTVQGHINYSPHWWVFVQEFPIKSNFRAQNTRAAQRFKGP